MAHGEPICACCASITGVECHHLYLKSDGCPDDLTVWLCHVCHGRAHGLARRVNISQRVRLGLQAAKANGKRHGQPKGYVMKGAAAGRVLGAAANAEKAMAFAEQLRPVLVELKDLSANAAASELEKRGIDTASGGKWSAGKVISLRERLGLGAAA